MQRLSWYCCFFFSVIIFIKLRLYDAHRLWLLTGFGQWVTHNGFVAKALVFCVVFRIVIFVFVLLWLSWYCLCLDIILLVSSTFLVYLPLYVMTLLFCCIRRCLTSPAYEKWKRSFQIQIKRVFKKIYSLNYIIYKIIEF